MTCHKVLFTAVRCPVFASQVTTFLSAAFLSTSLPFFRPPPLSKPAPTLCLHVTPILPILLPYSCLTACLSSYSYLKDRLTLCYFISASGHSAPDCLFSPTTLFLPLSLPFPASQITCSRLTACLSISFSQKTRMPLCL